MCLNIHDNRVWFSSVHLDLLGGIKNERDADWDFGPILSNSYEQVESKLHEISCRYYRGQVEAVVLWRGKLV